MGAEKLLSLMKGWQAQQGERGEEKEGFTLPSLLLISLFFPYNREFGYVPHTTHT